MTPAVLVRVGVAVGVRVTDETGVDVAAEPVLAMNWVATQPLAPVLVRTLDQPSPSTVRPLPMMVPVVPTDKVPMTPPE